MLFTRDDRRSFAAACSADSARPIVLDLLYSSSAAASLRIPAASTERSVAPATYRPAAPHARARFSGSVANPYGRAEERHRLIAHLGKLDSRRGAPGPLQRPLRRMFAANDSVQRGAIPDGPWSELEELPFCRVEVTEHTANKEFLNIIFVVINWFSDVLETYGEDSSISMRNYLRHIDGTEKAAIRLRDRRGDGSIAISTPFHLGDGRMTLDRPWFECLWRKYNEYSESVTAEDRLCALLEAAAAGPVHELAHITLAAVRKVERRAGSIEGYWRFHVQGRLDIRAECGQLSWPCGATVGEPDCRAGDIERAIVAPLSVECLRDVLE